MEFRSIFIANPAQLFVRRGQLVIRQEGERELPLLSKEETAQEILNELFAETE